MALLSSVKDYTYIASAKIKLLNLVFIIVSFLLGGSCRWVDLLADELERTFEAGEGELLWCISSEGHVDNSWCVRGNRVCRNDEVLGQTFLRSGHKDGYSF